MKVTDLIGRLEEENPDAEVRLMCQQQWPFEYSIYGVCSSNDLISDEDELEEEDTGRGLEEDEAHQGLVDRHPSTGITPKPDTVFLVEGSQLSYGDKSAWEVAW